MTMSMKIIYLQLQNYSYFKSQAISLLRNLSYIASGSIPAHADRLIFFSTFFYFATCAVLATSVSHLFTGDFVAEVFL